MTTSILVLIDGEHYPEVTRSGLEKLAESFNPVAAVFIGGTEKIDKLQELNDYLPYPVVFPDNPNSNDLSSLVLTALKQHPVDAVYDLSDEPIMDYQKRFDIANTLLSQGIDYLGPDFHFKAPLLKKILNTPSIAVYGTAKRVGKTAITGYIARVLTKNQCDVAIITMGRGGPKDPVLIKGNELNISPDYLLSVSQKGQHACSDHWEDACTSRVTTIGCRRCAGGMAGRVFDSNVDQGVKIANDLNKDVILLEGSGAAFPPVAADQHIVLIPVSQSIEKLSNFFGPMRIKKSQLAIISGVEDEPEIKNKALIIKQLIRKIHPKLPIAFTVLRPKPLCDIKDKKLFFATTAPQQAVTTYLIPYLESQYGCQVVGFSSALSNRQQLRKDIVQAQDAELYLTEIKAAGVDVVVQHAKEQGLTSAFVDNVPIIQPESTITHLDEALMSIADKAMTQF